VCAREEEEEEEEEEEIYDCVDERQEAATNAEDS
jgi:hypothetical protein